MKICPVGAQLFHVDAQIDRQTGIHEKARSCLSQFCEHT